MPTLLWMTELFVCSKVYTYILYVYSCDQGLVDVSGSVALSLLGFCFRLTLFCVWVFLSQHKEMLFWILMFPIQLLIAGVVGLLVRPTKLASVVSAQFLFQNLLCAFYHNWRLVSQMVTYGTSWVVVGCVSLWSQSLVWEWWSTWHTKEGSLSWQLLGSLVRCQCPAENGRERACVGRDCVSVVSILILFQWGHLQQRVHLSWQLFGNLVRVSVPSRKRERQGELV